MRNPKNRVSDPNEFRSCAGSKVKIQYAPKLGKDGRVELVESGKIDIKARINAYKEQTDISFILHQMAAGDTSVMNGLTPVYGDFTRMPTTMLEAMQADMDAEKAFYQLSPDIRNSFGNNYRGWLASIGSDDWKRKMNLTGSEDEMRSMNNLTAEKVSVTEQVSSSVQSVKTE